MKKNHLLYLSRADVETVGLDMPVVIDLLAKAYLEKSLGRVQSPAKPSIYPRDDSFITAMPAYIPSLDSAGIKWIAGFPGNTQLGMPYITGLLILNDVETGLPCAVMDCTWITAQRTGAKTALAAKYLAHPDSREVGILACGVQGRTNLRALSCLFPIRKVNAFDINPQAQEKFIQEMNKQYDFEIVGVETPRDAVIESDLIVISGPIMRSPNPTILKDWLKPGGFASAVDYDSYWSSDALAQMDIFVTDDLPQFLYQRQMGYFFNTPDPNLELADLVAGARPGRQNQEQRVLSMNLGLAMDDMAIAPEIFRQAREQDLGVWLSL
ncbi:MAG TPA: ornithine cyclodeaminase family protein [Anaerolineales bacterium]|nr:ornithine cyclodeaminase family protein [Anaerolineales bacterium]